MKFPSTQIPSLQSAPSPKHGKAEPVWPGPGALRVGVDVQGWVSHCGPVAPLCARTSAPGPARLRGWSWLLAGVGASLWIARYCKSWLLFLCSVFILRQNQGGHVCWVQGGALASSVELGLK